MVAVLVVTVLVLRRTLLGRYGFAIGGNEEAARLSGIKIEAVKIAAYVICGFCAAVGLNGRMRFNASRTARK